MCNWPHPFPIPCMEITVSGLAACGTGQSGPILEILSILNGLPIKRGGVRAAPADVSW